MPNGRARQAGSGHSGGQGTQCAFQRDVFPSTPGLGADGDPWDSRPSGFSPPAGPLLPDQPHRPGQSVNQAESDRSPEEAPLHTTPRKGAERTAKTRFP